MLINKLGEAADFKKLEKEIPPEYLLNIMVEVIRGLLSKLNLPGEEVDVFAEQVEERKRGDFFQISKAMMCRRQDEKLRTKEEKKLMRKITRR